MTGDAGPSAGTVLDPFAVLALLGEGGAVAAALGDYEDRPSQRDLTAWVTDVYNSGGIAMLEAGTGVGKSFAYLVPALAWARATGERTVVSTNTINLQEQLVGKDLPFLRDALADREWAPSFALLKGWRNYLCRLRLEHAAQGQQSLLERERVEELLGLMAWAGTTTDGTLADLPASPTPEVWDEVSAEPDLCTRQQCPHYDTCFVFRARRRAAAADIVVVNHHLLAADLAVRREADNWEDAAVLPPWRRVILDEAHHLEDVAAGHLGVQLSSRGMARLLHRLERQGKGVIPALQHDLAAAPDSLAGAALELIRARLTPAVSEARQQSGALVLRLAALVAEQGGGQLRLDDDFARAPVWSEGLTRELDGTLAAFRRIAEVIDAVTERLAAGEVPERRARLLAECRGVARRLDGAADGLDATLRPPAERPPDVRWLERSGPRSGALRLAAVPLDLAPLLREHLFDRVETAVLTSATLSAGGDFSFLASRVGVVASAGRALIQESCPSPFDYPSAALLGLPDDLPDPRLDPAGHGAAVVQVVAELAHAGDGGLFVLFTSHNALRQASQELDPLLGDRFPLLVQGTAPRDQLLRRFRESGRAILLGTDSFWEGVDVPGRALRGLILAKLPFKVPSEPMTAARLERLAEQGEDGFWSYLLPHAALKLKQGFGRLIRNRTDAGVVLLLDPRVTRRPYGAVLLDALPPAARIIGPWHQVRTACEDFYARHGIGATA